MKPKRSLVLQEIVPSASEVCSARSSLQKESHGAEWEYCYKVRELCPRGCVVLADEKIRSGEIATGAVAESAE